MFASDFLVLSLLVSLLCCANNAYAQKRGAAILCTEHPAYKNFLKPVLVSSWTSDLSSPTLENVAYLPRHTDHVYAPVDNLKSTKYRGLDLFHTHGRTSGSKFDMYFQRPARVYLFADVEDSAFDGTSRPKFAGWRFQEWAQRVKGADTITYGVHQKLEKRMYKYAAVFAKNTGGSQVVSVGQPKKLKEDNESAKFLGSFNLWIAEANGKPSPPVGKFKGSEIKPNTKCPEKLHDEWTTVDRNKEDKDTRGVKFTTWHPQWDPCFWCAYDHDHGSSPEHLMGYTPKFDYAARKFSRQKEDQRGFKGFVLDKGNIMVYLNIHVMTSILFRVGIRFHTIHLVVVHKRTKKVLMDISHKGDFGFLSVRLKSGKFDAINSDEQGIRDKQISEKEPMNFRSINIIDPKNPEKFAKIYKLRGKGKSLTVFKGQYEEWQTVPMCAKSKNLKTGINVQFKLPGTGIASAKKLNETVVLGEYPGKQKKSTVYRSVSLNRSVNFNNLNISSAFCPLLENGRPASGEFYTDPLGKEIVSGPGPTALRQFIAPGFGLLLNGRYETADEWTGLHVKNGRGFFIDFGYGIDPNKN